MEKHGHEHECDCGCGHTHQHSGECGCEKETVRLTFEDNSEAECEILGVFDAGQRQYIALLPLGGKEILIYRCYEKDDGATLEQIQSDEEYKTASTVLQELIGMREE